MEPWASSRKLQASVAVPWDLSGFLANGLLPRVSRLSTDKDETGNVDQSPRIYLTAGENPGKLQLGDRSMKAVLSVIASNGVP